MRPRSFIICCLVLCTYCETSAAADFKKSYVDGYKAFKKERWPEVERSMAAAVVENPSDGTTVIVISGEFRQTYMPHYYLALAKARLGRCAEALADWAIFGSAAGVRELSEYKSLAEHQRNCAEQVATAKSLEIEKALADLSMRFSHIQGMPQRRELAESWDSSAALGPVEAQISESVKRLGQDLASARNRADLDELGRIGENIERLSPKVEALESSMLRLAVERRSAVVDVPAPQVAAAPLDVEETRSAIRLSRELVRLAAVFFAGDYEQSLAAALKVEPHTEAERVQLWLFEAAAHHALSSLDPASAKSHIATATLQVKAVKRANPDFRPSAKYFCPAFVRFWSQVG